MHSCFALGACSSDSLLNAHLNVLSPTTSFLIYCVYHVCIFIFFVGLYLIMDARTRSYSF